MSIVRTPEAAGPDRRERLRAVGLGLLASVLWASSFVIMKFGLAYVGPLSMAGYRYLFGFLILLPLALRLNPPPAWRLPRAVWWQLIVLSIVMYPITNALLYWALTFISATTSSFFLFNVTPLVVVLMGIATLREVPSARQWAGIGLVALGMAIFFALPFSQGEIVGIIATGAGVLGFAWYNVQNRALARTGQIGAVLLTALPLGIGAPMLIVIALFVEGLPRWDPLALLVVLWLAAFNTALANTVWIKALTSLKAFELSVLMNVVPAETALMAWLTLGEEFSPNKILGIALVIPGILLVQWASMQRPAPAKPATEAAEG